MVKLKGTVGYTLLQKETHKPNKILILADSHDTLEYCTDSENVSDFLKSKQLTNNILLEEVVRDKLIKLKELWPDSPHTQLLKKYYLEDIKSCTNDNCIKALDIRPFFIIASLEFIDNKITLRQYMIHIDTFFKFENNIFKKQFGNVYSYYFFNKKQRLLIHFNLLKKNYLDFINKYRDKLDQPLKLYNSQTNNNIKLDNYIEIDNYINTILSDIMEFYIILKLYQYRKKNSIIHLGKYHYDKIIFWLKELYEYEIIEEFNDDKYKGCITIDKNIM